MRLRSLAGLGFLAIAWTIPSDANDAFVLPGGVFRFTSGTTALSGTEAFDSGGETTGLGAQLGPAVLRVGQALNGATSGAFPGGSWNGLNPAVSMEASIFREDLAFEYGFTDRLTFSIQTPMYLGGTVATRPDADMSVAIATLNAQGAPSAGGGKVGELFSRLAADGKKAGTLGDVTVGGKFQFANSGSTPISQEPGTYRAAVAFGASLPTGSLASPDTNDFSTTKDDSLSWILGARTYWDYQFSSSFYLNFYTEHEYRLAGASKYLDVDSATLSYRVLDVQYRPGMYHHLEFDFAVVPKLSEVLSSDSGVRITGDITGRGTYTGAPSGYESIVGESREGSTSTQFVPYLGLFYTGLKLPMKLKTLYYAPMAGRNSERLNGFSFVLQALLRL